MIVWLRVAAGFAMFGLNTVVHVTLLFIVAICKAVIRIAPLRPLLDDVLTRIAESWIGVNTRTLRALTSTRIIVESSVSPEYRGHYLVLSNHQSWVDIPVLQAVFNRKIPLLRFFLKSQLIWVPLLGLAWWALDFPFMKRYSRETLARRPDLASRDIAAARRACRRFLAIPISVLIFPEGTRMTPAKHATQRSPFRHLLKPKAGGIAFALETLGGALHRIIDVTIAYPHGKPTFADLFANRIPEVRIHCREREIPIELVHGDYENDAAARSRAHAWINSLWQEKDERLSASLEPAAEAAYRTREAG